MIRTKGIHADTSGQRLAAQIEVSGSENRMNTLLGIGRTLAGGVTQIAQNRKQAEAEARAAARQERADAIAAEKESWDRQQWLATQTGEIPAEMEAAVAAPMAWPQSRKGTKPG